MSHEISELKHYFREQVRTKPQLKNVNPDRLTVATLAMNLQAEFYKGYFGRDRMSKALREGAELRRKDPQGYDRELARLAPHLGEIRQMGMNTVRIAETLTSSDLVFAIGTLRDAELNDNRPAFQTDLYDLVNRRTRNNLKPIRSRGGVELADRLLRVRAENTTNIKTSWIARGTNYSMVNLEEGVELTWEAIVNDELDEQAEVVYELGQNAARTRAWLIVDAVRRSANFVRLPDGDLGPNVDNIDAAAGYLGQQVRNGATYSRSLTDIYVPGIWRQTANRSVNGAQVVIVGGANGDVQRVNPNNPAANTAVHVEEVMGELPVDTAEYPNQSNADWIAADPARKPVEFSTHTLFAAGPRILTKIPNIVELDNMGSFSEHVIETKVSDVAGAEVTDQTAILLVSGQKAG